MSDFLLFTCKKDEPAQEKRINLFKYIYKLLINRVKEPEFDELIEQVELFDDVKMCAFRLPCLINEIGIKSSKLAKYGEILRSRFDNITCITPKKFAGLHPFEGCINNCFSGRILFKSLLIQIIDEIYTKRNIEVSALDISIIHGVSFEELYTVLNQLSPYIKFLTIITEEKEQVEEAVSKIYYETGLAVRVTNEYRSGMKNADLIINFSTAKELVFNTRINPRALIINYGEINHNKFLCDNIIVNGLEVEIPKNINTRFNKETYEYYSKVELAEIILSHKALVQDRIIEGIYNLDLADILYREFKKAGFSITGFAGRRNIFKARDIVLHGA